MTYTYKPTYVYRYIPFLALPPGLALGGAMATTARRRGGERNGGCFEWRNLREFSETEEKLLMEEREPRREDESCLTLL